MVTWGLQFFEVKYQGIVRRFRDHNKDGHGKHGKHPQAAADGAHSNALCSVRKTSGVTQSERFFESGAYGLDLELVGYMLSRCMESDHLDSRSKMESRMEGPVRISFYPYSF
jgi:hypothetical protein